MADVPLYDRTYARFGLPARQQVRHETYGEDLGQNSWLTVDEWNAMIGWITPRHRSRVLDVGCGSGGPDLYLAQQTGAQIVGIDMNADAVSTANAAAAESGLASLASFQQADASTALPFADGSFDAVFCIDAVNHLRNRLRVFQEWHRVLKPHGQVVFTDPVVVTGLLTNEEIAARTSIGIFVLSLLEEDHRLLDQAGFDLLRSDDSTDNVATVARRWLEARAVRRQELEEDEGPTAFQGMQQFLTIVHTLAAERRLSRYTFLARVR
jgi:SAM-dependent methyltransferase